LKPLIQITGAHEHNLKQVDVEFEDGLTVVTGVSGSGKSSLVYDTFYHEAHRHFVELFARGRSARLAPARVESIKGLAPSVAIGQNLLNRNPGSTLATATGLHPFLRILFTNFGSRHCSACDTELTLWNEEDLVRRLVTLSKRGSTHVSALLVRATLGSHRTLLASLSSSFGADHVRVDGRTWSTSRRLKSKAPHDIAVRLARLNKPIRLKQARELLSIGRSLGTDLLELESAGNVQLLALSPVCAACGGWFNELLPVHFHMSCRYCEGEGCDRCGGTGLHEQAAAVRWQGLRLTELLALSVDALAERFASAELPNSARRLVTEVERRLQALQSAGLGYVQLDRAAPTLSRGEGQRARLAVALTSRLEGMVHILDEPTIGLHPADVARLVPDLRLLPGPVIFVEHDRVAAAEADRVVDIGPGAGTRGGEILYSGTPAGLWRTNSPTGRFFSLRERMAPPPKRAVGEQFATIRGARLHNLKGIDVPLAVAGLNVISGVSGSGKSTLVEDVLVASLRQDAPVGCTSIEGPRMDVLLVDQSPIGRNPRSNPATYTKLADIIRDGFAAATDLSASHFSFNRPEGACPMCKGMGAVEIAMRYLPSAWIPCSSCDGSRFSEEVRERSAPFGDRQLSITEFLSLSVDEVHGLMQAEAPLSESKRRAAMRILTALTDIGLGYLTLGQSSPSLSGGEAQRVKLARHLGSRSLANKLLVLDEPTTGLHPSDISGLLLVLDRLVRSGATVVVVEHNLDVMNAADWLVDLGPGAGPDGGQLIFAGPPAEIHTASQSLTGRALNEEQKIRPRGRKQRVAEAKQQISVRAANCNNLRSVDVDIPKAALTVVTGVSGSGKSSLVRDVLEAEARRRYLESLSMYERQVTREGPEAEVGELAGLGVTVPITARRSFLDPRSTLGSISEISHHLAGLMARIGRLACDDCGKPMIRKETYWSCSRCERRQPVAQPRHFIAAI
jgi:excinuclease ABC subunit A|tara:strand:- start:41 stop:2929 length:2889 start_codon:yes stop_codon:yes gene_type:complete